MNNAHNTPSQSGEKPDPAHQSLVRLLWLKIGLLIFFAVVAARLVQIQVFESAKYREIAKKQYEVNVPLLASRGNIYDRNGKILVSSSMAVSYAADPKFAAKDAEKIADRFARVFGESRRSDYRARSRKNNSRFVWLERRANPETAARIKATEFDGIIQMNEPRRIYHYDHVAGQALGFTDIDNNGLSGIELEFEQQLKGKNGFLIMQRDGLGRKRPTVDYPRVEPINGNNIVLTIDLDIQSVAEEELKKGIEANGASSGLVLVLDPATGEILAMASWPSINPNYYQLADPAATKNRVITDVFEPGSVFKVVTVSAALEHKLIDPTQKFYAEKGKYVVKGRPKPITDVHQYGMLTFREAVELSSNIVMAKASDIIGAANMYTTARNYGFGTPTGLELPGEVGGQLKRPNEWSRTTLNTMAYGYEVGVTPLQLAAAYAAVANGGKLMRPYILKQVLDEHNVVSSETNAEVIRRVISQSTADTIRSFMRGVVERGTATAAKSAVVHIAGKTGTSRKIIDGRYSLSSYTASFVGMFPAENPQVVCLAMLDNPRKLGYYGGVASAPIVKNIAEKVMATSSALAQAAPSPVGQEELLTTPDVRAIEVESATRTLEALGFEVEVTGEGIIVTKQAPEAGTRIARSQTVRLATSGVATTVAGGYTIVPQLKGMSLRRALNQLTAARLDVKIEGSGLVASQSISAGTQVKVGTRVGIRCEAKRFPIMTSL
ncbi:MAG: PASTA domain-containing protein [Ignavibacteriae bacterium]|nr:PASTA domain-containing protein [Ignavibacteriota bacterium]